MRRWTRPIRHGLAYFALRILVLVLRCLPTRTALWLGARLGRLVGVFARTDTRRMQRHLQHLNNPPPVSVCWADLGRRFVELCVARRLIDQVEIKLPEPLPTGPVVVMTTHLGNWELLAATLVARGFAVHAVGARAQSGPLFRWLNTERAQFGVAVYSPGHARRARKHLANDGVLALFIDQNTGERSRPIDFLGEPAPTPITAERLRDTAQASMYFAWLVHVDGAYRGAVEPAADLDAGTARLAQLIEQYPEQWVWQHRRWGRVDP